MLPLKYETLWCHAGIIIRFIFAWKMQQSYFIIFKFECVCQNMWSCISEQQKNFARITLIHIRRRADWDLGVNRRNYHCADLLDAISAIGDVSDRWCDDDRDAANNGVCLWHVQVCGAHDRQCDANAPMLSRLSLQRRRRQWGICFYRPCLWLRHWVGDPYVTRITSIK